jgi:hypothetical protein
MKNNAADYEDIEMPDLGSEIPDEDEDSISLGIDAEIDEDYSYQKLHQSFELDPNVDTLIKKHEEDYNLF